MQTVNAYLTRVLAGLLAFTLLGGPQLVQAQQSTLPDAPSATLLAQTTAPQNPVQQSSPSQNAQPANPQPQPSQPQGTQTAQPAQAQPSQPAPTDQQAPAGAAAAPAGATAGGAASRPAGNAIAPAKQRQVRSLLIKLGAVAAAGAAVGVVYALSRSSPAVPPGAPAR